MFLEDPPRVHAGLRTALALTSIALGQHDSVGLFPFSDDLRVALRPRSGKARLMRFAEVMASLEPGGVTDLRRVVQTFSAYGLREGLAVVISDFFDPGGIEAVLDALKRLRHRVLLVQLVRATDEDPGVRGDLQLLDCETR